MRRPLLLLILVLWLPAGAQTEVEIGVPQVVNLSQVEASERVRAAGLRSEVHRMVSERPEGQVLFQVPSAGKRVEATVVVLLYVAEHAQEVPEPAAPVSRPPPSPPSPVRARLGLLITELFFLGTLALALRSLSSRETSTPQRLVFEIAVLKER